MWLIYLKGSELVEYSNRSSMNIHDTIYLEEIFKSNSALMDAEHNLKFYRPYPYYIELNDLTGRYFVYRSSGIQINIGPIMYTAYCMNNTLLIYILL